MKAPADWGTLPRFVGSYADYLTSDEWAQRRDAVRWRARGRCERCGSTRRPQHVHHLTYERLGHEAPGDLALLCEGCHRAEHGMPPAETSMHTAGGAIERLMSDLRKKAA